MSNQLGIRVSNETSYTASLGDRDIKEINVGNVLKQFCALSESDQIKMIKCSGIDIKNLKKTERSFRNSYQKREESWSTYIKKVLEQKYLLFDIHRSRWYLYQYCRIFDNVIKGITDSKIENMKEFINSGIPEEIYVSTLLYCEEMYDNRIVEELNKCVDSLFYSNGDVRKQTLNAFDFIVKIKESYQKRNGLMKLWVPKKAENKQWQLAYDVIDSKKLITKIEKGGVDCKEQYDNICDGFEKLILDRERESDIAIKIDFIEFFKNFREHAHYENVKKEVEDRLENNEFIQSILQMSTITITITITEIISAFQENLPGDMRCEISEIENSSAIKKNLLSFWTDALEFGTEMIQKYNIAMSGTKNI